ncbi:MULTISPECIES: LuxR C-terminal-related transcriptional regulator [Pseudoalteromonas]|jgi:DNA-binding CsgD family transcriptional regulator|uniref:LuxR C-terminal-related transcriptional regulator n=1 Tax=Pseudoalteromonas TaxID=53246 RepID=UPI00020A0BBD|nr:MULTISPECIES: LuxR C-terminal-related transcriptional regulator [Pseudoalteromonas]EGI72876.1 hypothetical protein PH505_bb00240 [Pseudoalteromonas distincta]MBB1307264.1 hypothetical protein [Pseudoalteromonas sp. SR43-5]
MLNNYQKGLLNQLAQGKTNYEIGASNSLNQTELNIELRNMQARLGAKTLAHLMHRAWELGLLGARTLCLCIAIFGASTASDISKIRPVRIARTQMRLTRRQEAA